MRATCTVANDLFAHFLRIPVSLASVFRVSNALGAQLEAVLPASEPERIEVAPSEVVYASMAWYKRMTVTKK
ncbi:MAG TPA: hypothetical protein PLL64_08880 [Rhodothermales bacterium]|nr:hypothetical protein [Rhodothermales bacterium]HRR10153.1 hypothetical protein [Rhodothermales bacterium]